MRMTSYPKKVFKTKESARRFFGGEKAMKKLKVVKRYVVISK